MLEIPTITLHVCCQTCYLILPLHVPQFVSDTMVALSIASTN
jgi:hypothetical protein